MAISGELGEKGASRRVPAWLVVVAVLAAALAAYLGGMTLWRTMSTRNALDEMIINSKMGDAYFPFGEGSHCVETPVGFYEGGPSGTDPAANTYYTFDYEGDDLGFPAVQSAGEGEEVPAGLSVLIRRNGPTLIMSCTTPRIYDNNGGYYLAFIDLTYTVGDSAPELSEYYYAAAANGDAQDLSRDEWLAATGVDGDELDAWAEHAFRDLFMGGYFEANADWTHYSMDNLGEGISLEDGFLARMRASGVEG